MQEADRREVLQQRLRVRSTGTSSSMQKSSPRSILVTGRGPSGYFVDSGAIGSFHAMKSGITIVCSRGNSGSKGGSASNVAPWIMAVGASTTDREFPSYASLGPWQRADWSRSPSFTLVSISLFLNRAGDTPIRANDGIANGNGTANGGSPSFSLVSISLFLNRAGDTPIRERRANDGIH